MNFELWDTLINLVMLAFWYQIWRDTARSDDYNPYMQGINNPAQSTINFFKHAIPGFSPRTIAWALLAICIIFRALIAQGDVWELSFGFEKGRPATDILARLIFSTFSFAMFLFNIWGLSLIFARSERDTFSEHTSSALFMISQPFVRIPVKWRPLALYAFGILLATVLMNLNALPSPPLGLRAVISHAMISSFMAWIDLLNVLIKLLLILIIGSWVTMIAGSINMSYFCKNWMDLILGPMRKVPMIIGPLDLTPIVFMFVASFLYGILKLFLHGQYLGLSS
ncbi:MAG: YggT family protein [Verrucomicrobia bacterium]|nr:YggT family protein [Verrucomicrobiota bacterium]